MARLDGRSFHAFTRSLARPYDIGLTRLMQETTLFLVKETNANMGYTQSDEITLTWLVEKHESQIFFNGRVQKMTSQLSALASVYFNKHLPEYLPDKIACMPTFDCRVWSVPTLDEGANVFLWRELDATKNSITMAALDKFSPKEILGRKGKEKIEMLFQKGVNWNDYPSYFKRGSYFQRAEVFRSFTCDELEKLPEKHNARLDPTLQILRTGYGQVDMPPFLRVANPVQVIYHGNKPILRQDEAELSEDECE